MRPQGMAFEVTAGALSGFVPRCHVLTPTNKRFKIDPNLITPYRYRGKNK
jgi:hypothetical protein